METVSYHSIGTFLTSDEVVNLAAERLPKETWRDLLMNAAKNNRFKPFRVAGCDLLCYNRHEVEMWLKEISNELGHKYEPSENTREFWKNVAAYTGTKYDPSDIC